MEVHRGLVSYILLVSLGDSTIHPVGGKKKDDRNKVNISLYKGSLLIPFFNMDLFPPGRRHLLILVLMWKTKGPTHAFL